MAKIQKEIYYLIMASGHADFDNVNLGGDKKCMSTYEVSRKLSK